MPEILTMEVGGQTFVRVSDIGRVLISDFPAAGPALARVIKDEFSADLHVCPKGHFLPEILIPKIMDFVTKPMIIEAKSLTGRGMAVSKKRKREKDLKMAEEIMPMAVSEAETVIALPKAKIRGLIYRDGRYFARLTVPRALRFKFPKTELRVSLGGDRDIALRRLPEKMALFA